MLDFVGFITSRSCEDSSSTLPKCMNYEYFGHFIPSLLKSTLFFCNLLNLCLRRGRKQPLSTLAKMHTELGDEHATLAAVSEEVLAKYFKEASAMRLEKKIDKTNSVLSCHTEEIKTIPPDTTKLQQRISNTEKTTADC